MEEHVGICIDCIHLRDCMLIEPPMLKCGFFKYKKGVKFDEDKPKWDLLPWEAVEEVVKIITFGATKYEPENWKKLPPNRIIAALMRHLVADQVGEDYDEESGFLHLSHLACNALFLVWLKLEERKNNGFKL